MGNFNEISADKIMEPERDQEMPPEENKLPENRRRPD
jgi:hypothetical protein